MLGDRASETHDMVQAAPVEDSLSNLEGTKGFQNSNTKQTSTEDKKNENADRNGTTEIHPTRPTLNQQYFTDVKRFGENIIWKVFQIEKFNVLEVQQHSRQAL
jgi:hypothetical protein